MRVLHKTIEAVQALRVFFGLEGKTDEQRMSNSQVVSHTFAPIATTSGVYECETHSGRYIDLVNPNPADICIEDIAWSLSRQSRFVGHTLGEPYYVAQHACFVHDLVDSVLTGKASDLMQKSFDTWMGGMPVINPMLAKKHALCHDNSEAYLVDLPSPLKQHPELRKIYKELEKTMVSAVNSALNLPEMTMDIHLAVHWGDLMALRIEAAALMPSRGRGWGVEFPEFDLSFIELMPKIQSWRTAYLGFLGQYHELQQGASNTGIR